MIEWFKEAGWRSARVWSDHRVVLTHMITDEGVRIEAATRHKKVGRIVGWAEIEHAVVDVIQIAENHVIEDLARG